MSSFDDAIIDGENGLVIFPIGESVVLRLTFEEWEVFVNKILKFQKGGHYVSHGHGQIVGPQELQDLIEEFYGFQINVDVDRV